MRQQPVPVAVNPLAEYHQGQLYETLYSLGKVNAVLGAVHASFNELNNFSEETVRSIIGLVFDDLVSLHDDIQRHLEGRCGVRGSACATLRPSQQWEDVYVREMERIHAGGAQ